MRCMYSYLSSHYVSIEFEAAKLGNFTKYQLPALYKYACVTMLFIE